MKLEVPYSPDLAEAVWLAAGGTILAGQLALCDGFASNLTGGFHHAYANHGEGFCAINDVAIAIRRLQHDKLIKKAIVVDTDVHHGNGTAHIFRNDDSVFTLSIHQQHNYPAEKPPSNLDLHLDDGVEDQEYLAVLLPSVEKSLDEFRPDILFYVGGADPFCEDQLGGLRLTKSGLKSRDKSVFQRARSRNIPVATTLAGGYARRVEDTIRIHGKQFFQSIRKHFVRTRLPLRQIRRHQRFVLITICGKKHHLRIPGVTRRHLFINWFQRMARSAPRSPKIDHQHFAFLRLHR